MRPVLRRRVLAALVAVAALALAGAAGAGAATVTEHDGQGRAITFDVRASNVDVGWYASVLSAAAHGNEISDVTIRIVPEPQIPLLCGGQDAAACYLRRTGRPEIVVQAGKSLLLESTLLHEYGHHLDTYWHVAGISELNGTDVWWAARGMQTLLQNHQVAFDYSLGWEHSIGEIFAEDYAYIHTGRRYSIPWLAPPDDSLKAALFAELGSPFGPLPAAPDLPLIINRTGTLVPRDSFVVPFGLLGPGRRVTLTATFSKPKRKGVRARALVVCDGLTVASRTFAKGQTKRTLDLPNLGPAKCEARLVSTSPVALTYTMRLRLAVEST
jgi:hypothetical protein